MDSTDIEHQITGMSIDDDVKDNSDSLMNGFLSGFGESSDEEEPSTSMKTQDDAVDVMKTNAERVIVDLHNSEFMLAVRDGVSELMETDYPIELSSNTIWTPSQENDVLAYLSNHVSGWKFLMTDNMVDPVIATSVIHSLFGSAEHGDERILKVRRRVNTLYNLARHGIRHGSPQVRDDFQEHSDNMGIVCVAIENAAQIYKQHVSIRQAQFKTYSSFMDSIAQLSNGENLDERSDKKIKLKPHQLLYARLLREAYDNQYRKQGDELFKPVYVNGKYIYAYERAMSIRAYVNGMLMRHQDAETFAMMTEKQSTYTQLIRDLTQLDSIYLPELEPNRYVMAFKNGLFWLDAPEAFDDEGNRLPPKRFFPFVEGEVPDCMAGDSVAVSFHRMDYDYKGIEREMREWINEHPDRPIIEAYRGISMHPFNEVLEYQGYTDAEREFVFGMLGRLMFKHNYRGDNFESELWFNGKAGTGKSTFMKWIQFLYTNKKHVGVISNNVERTYPLAGIADCLVYLVFEMNKNFNLDQMTYQSMVSGETVTIAAKYKTATEVEWSAHGACACNQLPNWRNNFGSLRRRICVIEFSKKVQEINDHLFSDGCQRIDRFLAYNTAAYNALLYSVVGNGGRPFQSVVPQKIKNNTIAAMTGCNPLLNYLSNEWEIVDEKEHVEPVVFSQFQQKMNQYFIMNNVSERPSRNALVSRLEDEGVRITKQHGVTYLCNLRPVQ